MKLLVSSLEFVNKMSINVKLNVMVLVIFIMFGGKFGLCVVLIDNMKIVIILIINFVIIVCNK